MNKAHKKQKELEKIIIKKEIALCNEIQKDIQIYEKVNEISSNINKKREREISRSENQNSNNTPNLKTNIPPIDLHSTLDKLIEIAEKQKSFEKTMKLMNCLIIKAKEEHSLFKLTFLIKMFYLIMTSPFKHNPISLAYQYKELFSNAISIITNEDKEYDEGSLYDVFFSFNLIYTYENALYEDDSFLFNAATKIIIDTLQMIDTPYEDKDKLLLQFENELKQKKHIVIEHKLIDELKRKMCFDMFKGMAKYSKLAMKVHVKQFFKNIMLNYQMKLTEEMKKIVIEQINELSSNKGKSNIVKIVRDDKIKTTPIDNYYQTNDARDEKYMVSNYDKWESKQNGIESTKQYFG